ncbi:MAG: polysaccharide biosynthesis protein [Clostridia bacterium]|nr:polysaccharide biosynthesis protein [Clostridia bacterium]
MKNNTKIKKTANLFASGVLILTIANLIVKVIGVMLKIPLSNELLNEGMGYYNSAYEVYVWLYMVSTAGIPVAIAMMVSESKAKGNFREIKKIYKISLITFATVGFVFMAALMISSGWLADKVYKLEGLEWGLIAIAPTLFFICISCAIRGYFQGYQYMTPTAISEVIESLGKLIIGLALGKFAMKSFDGVEKAVGKTVIEMKYPYAAAFTILGLTIGVALSLVYLFLKKARFKEELYNAEFVNPESDTMEVRGTAKILTGLIVVAIPVTLSSSVMSFTTMLDSIIISNKLQGIGLNQTAVAETIGYYKTQVITFFNLPPVLIYPISGSLVPYLSALIVGKDKEKIHNIMNSALRVASLIALPCALGMSVLSEPIIKLIFASKLVDQTNSPQLLSIQALSVFFVAMLAMTTSILQAHKLERKPIISMLAGACVKITASWFLIGNKHIQMYGAPISTFLSYLTIVLFNFYFVAKHVKYIPDFKKVFVRPLLASVVCAGSAIGSYYIAGLFVPKDKIVTLIAIGVAALVYIVSIFIIRALNKEDFELIPKGEKLYKICSKLKLVK